MTANPNITPVNEKSKYWSKLLHIDHDDLDADQYYLLGYYRKMIGWSGGEPWVETIKETAAGVKWDEKKTRRVRAELALNGIIRVEPANGRANPVSVVDRCQQNNEIYASKPLPKMGSTQKRYGSKTVGQIGRNRGGVQAVPLKEQIQEINTSTSNEVELRPPQPQQDTISFADQLHEADKMVTPKPTIFKAVVKEEIKPTPSVPPVPPRAAQPHIAPLLAWFNALGSELKPAEFQLGPYTKWGKDMARQIDIGTLSESVVTEAGRLAKAWYTYNFAPDPMLVRWDVGGQTEMQRQFSRAFVNGVTVDEIRDCLASMIGHGYWQGKNVPFDKLLAHIPEWRKGKSRPPQGMANPLPSQRERKPDMPIVSILDATQKRPLGGA